MLLFWIWNLLWSIKSYHQSTKKLRHPKNLIHYFKTVHWIADPDNSSLYTPVVPTSIQNKRGERQALRNKKGQNSLKLCHVSSVELAVKQSQGACFCLQGVCLFWDMGTLALSVCLSEGFCCSLETQQANWRVPGFVLSWQPHSNADLMLPMDRWHATALNGRRSTRLILHTRASVPLISTSPPSSLVTGPKLIILTEVCHTLYLQQTDDGWKTGLKNTLERTWEPDSHVWTKFIEVPVAIFLHLVRRVDGKGPVGVHGDHHTANVCLERGEGREMVSVNPHGVFTQTDKSPGFNNF